MKKKNLEELKKDNNGCDEWGLFGLFFLWYLYRELERQAIIEYLEEQKILDESDSEIYEDTKRLVKKK